METKTPPVDDFLVGIYNVIVTIQARMASDEEILEAPENRVVLRTLALINTESHRFSLIAYFLSGASVEQISASLGIEEDVVDMFGQLIVNLREINNKLELRDYARKMESECYDADIKREIQGGYLHGPAYLQLAWKHGDEPIDIKEKDITRSMLMLGFEKGLLSRNAPINSAETREALKWSGHILKVIPVHNSIEEKQSLLEEAILAITKRQTDDAKEVVDIANIVH